MSAAPPIDIDYVAQLARLALSPEEKVRFSRQLGDILGYIEKLKEVDVSGVEPTAHAMPLANVWREDRAQAGLPAAALAAMAPASRQNQVVVPQVVEDGS